MSARHLGFLSFVLVAVLATDAPLEAQQLADEAAEHEIATAPVEFDGAVLFHVRGVSSFPAATRARQIRDRLAAIAANPTVAADSLRIVESGSASQIWAGNQLVMGVFEADAELEQVGREVLAGSHLSSFKQAITSYREARTSAALRRNVVNALIGTLLFALAIVALAWFGRWVDRFLARRLQARIRSVGIQSFELMRAERIWAALRSALFAVRTVVFVAMALVYLGFMLGQFPATRGLSRNMIGFALEPLAVMGRGVLDHVPSLVFLTILFFVFRLVLRLVRLFFDAVERGTVTLANFEPEWAQPTYKILRFAIVAFGLVIAYPYVPGSDTAAFKGVSLFIGIVFSLGSSSAISNIIAGYMMTYRRAFKVGDRVKIGNAFGDVVQMRLQVTHLRSLKNEEIILPNSQILAGEVVNYSSLARTEGLILHTEVGIGYETPWRQVEAMLLMAAQRTPGLLAEPRPFVLQKTLGDFAITYELNVYCGDVQAMNRLYTELHRNILDVFNEYGVQIMTPAYERDPEVPKLVAPENWYTTPARPASPTTPTTLRDDVPVP